MKKSILQNIRSLFDNSALQGIIILSNGKIIYANNTAIEIYSLSKKGLDNLHYENMMKNIHPEDSAKIKSYLDLYDKDEDFEINMEFRYKRKIGSYKWIKVYAKNLVIDDEKYIIENVSDITESKLSERKLKENEQKYRNFIEQTSEGISYLEFDLPISITLDTEEQIKLIYKYGYISECNLALAKMYGLENESGLIGKRLVDIHGSDNNPLNVKSFSDLINNNYRLLNTVTEEINQDGNKIYFINNSIGIISDNYLLGIWGTQIDITERQKTQQLITATYKISEAVHISLNLPDLFKSIHTIVAGLMPAKNFYIALYDEEKNLINFPYFIDEYDENIITKKPDKGITEYVLKTGKPLLATKEIINELIHNEEIRNIGSDSIDWLGVPLKHMDKTIGVLAVQTYEQNIRYTSDDMDILAFVSDQVAMAIERKSSEEALKSSEVKNRAIVSAIPDLIFIQDYNGVYLEYHARDEGLLYTKPEEFLGKNMQDIFPQYLYELFSEVIQKTINNNEIQICEYPIEIKGEIRNFEARFIAYGGNRILSIIRDITQREMIMQELIESKERAEELSKIKSNFLSNMSHELRTPLHGILGFSQILYDEIENEDRKSMANTIYQSGKRLMDTLNLILNFSKVESNKVEVNYVDLNINKIIEDTITLFRNVALNKGLELYYDIKENIFARLDERFFRDIMNNLVNNAIKFTEKGSIKVEGKIEKTNIIISVKDTGIGIPKNKINLIFEEFRQESEGLSRNFEGTGLGLTLTKKYVELMHGRIEVESEVGIGSTFKVILPIIEEPKVKKTGYEFLDPPSITILPTREDKKDILLVENDKVSAMLVKSYLTKMFELDIVDNGLEAYRKAATKKYDLILMDINLGEGLTGIDATQKIRELQGYANVPIVAVTAFALESDKDEFIKYGCTHYIAKPFEQKELLELLKNILL